MVRGYRISWYIVMGFILSKYKQTSLDKKYANLNTDICEICYELTPKKNIRFVSEHHNTTMCRRCYIEYKKFSNKKNGVKSKKKKNSSYF